MGQELSITNFEEVQRSHLLELLVALGDMVKSFVLVGGQAMQFRVNNARKTNDYDFVLDVIALREGKDSLAEILKQLNYSVVPKSLNFQFEKTIIGAHQSIRIEFLGSDRSKRKNDIRVDVQDHIHARACIGSEIVLQESDPIKIKGPLPKGQIVEKELRIVRSHALLLLKLFAMEDRYDNIRGPNEAEHDRNEARIHAADSIEIVHANIQSDSFIGSFWSQLATENELRNRARNILSIYFLNESSPGIMLYGEFILRQNLAIDRKIEMPRVLREMQFLLSKGG